MDSLSAETWDAVIAGTSLPQSLLALALSKCDLKILHVDKNDHYGGLDAGLSLDEAERWIRAWQENGPSEHLSLTRSADADTSLRPSRAYTIALKPQIIYAKSRILPTLVSSQLHSQLEFQAVGSIWVYTDGKLQKIPSSREDVFADDTISVRDKRRLMGLLRYVLEDEGTIKNGTDTSTLEAKLHDQFKLPEHLQVPVQALTLSTDTLSNTRFEPAMARLKLHLASMGYFGPGLAAVMAKYGGNAEIAQVACRAGAVGGFVYLLGHGVKAIQTASEDKLLMSIELSDGTVVKARHVVGIPSDLPNETLSAAGIRKEDEETRNVAHRICIVSQPLRHLFVSASESGPVPAVAIVLVGDGSKGKSPVYLQIHSEDTGECPTGQCIIYASCLDDDDTAAADSQTRLAAAIDNLLSTSDKPDRAEILWSISFATDDAPTRPSHTTTASTSTPVAQDTSGRILVFPRRPHAIAFDDTVLDGVKAVWQTILGDRSAEHDFLRFEQRRDDDDD